MTIIEFVEARLADEAKAAGSMPDPAKHRRIVDALAAMAFSVVNQLKSSGVALTDNPLAAGLLVPASVWSDHPDFTPRAWFPKMIGEMK